MKYSTVNVILAVLLAVSAIGCVVALYADPVWLLYMTAVPFFCGQLLLCRLSGRWQIRIIPSIPVLFVAGMALYLLIRDHSWDRLAALIYGLACIAPALGIIAALCVAQKRQ